MAECKDSNKVPTLEEFFDKNLEQIASVTDLRQDLCRIWSKAFFGISSAAQFGLKDEVSTFFFRCYILYCNILMISIMHAGN